VSGTHDHKEFEVDVTFSFSGKVRVRAVDAGEALVVVQRDLGLVLGGNIHTSNDQQVVNWDFDTHPTQLQNSVQELRTAQNGSGNEDGQTIA